MKNIVFLSILLVSTATLFAQATKQKSTIFFKDGSEKNCFARISGDNIRYSETKLTSKETIVGFNEISGIKISMDKVVLELVYKNEENHSKPKLMELVINDKIKLYRISDVYQNNIGYNTNPDYLNKRTATTVFFLESKTNKNEVVRIGRNFEQFIKDYFVDCKLLIEKIGTKDFRKKDIFKIVNYYNQNCSIN